MAVLENQSENFVWFRDNASGAAGVGDFNATSSSLRYTVGPAIFNFRREATFEIFTQQE
jgi:hypothetical protein